MVHPASRRRYRGRSLVPARPFIVDHMLMGNMQTDTAIHSHRGRGEAARVYVPSDLQTLQDYQDKVNQTIMVLEANNDVLASLRSFYHALPNSSAFTLKDTCGSDITSFTKQVDEMIHDSSMQVSRAKLLIRITSDRKDLVSEQPTSVGSLRTKMLPGRAAPANSSDSKNGRLDNQYARYRGRVPKGSHHHANHHCSDISISPRNIRICKSI